MPLNNDPNNVCRQGYVDLFQVCILVSVKWLRFGWQLLRRESYNMQRLQRDTRHRLSFIP